MLLFPSACPTQKQDVLERRLLALQFSPSAQSLGLATGGCWESVGASNWRDLGRWGAKCWEVPLLLPWAVLVGVESVGNVSGGRRSVKTVDQRLSCIAG